jgi:3-hydroxybutyryl-CoA dehydrogenase
MANITTVGVLGAGLMGSGIAQVCAQSGFTTRVREVSETLCQKGKANIDKSFNRAIEKSKGKVTEADRDAAMQRLTFTTSVADLADCDLVVEAVVEDLEVKNAIWKELDALCPPHTIFASNTSSLTIAAMAAATARPDRMVGLHFFNPVPVMKLVEVVRTVTTSDNSGFVVNLLLVPYLVDAINALEHGVASVEDIDKGMMLGTGYPMGPFTLLDFVGLDTTYKIAEIMFDEYREKRYAPPPLLKRMVLAGMYGRKSGKGFYDYSVDPPRVNELGL